MIEASGQSQSAAAGSPAGSPAATSSGSPPAAGPASGPAEGVAGRWAAGLARLGSGLRHLLAAAVLVIIALLVFLPGFAALPVTDRDEARFVQATRQMVETGDWIDIRFQDEARYKKPVGIYWLQAAAVTLHGGGADAPIWVYRLPSLTGAVLSVLLVYAIGVALAGPGVGFAAGLLAIATLLLGVEARLAKTDAALLASVLAAQWALASLWMANERKPNLWRNAVFWTALGIGTLIKGPVILLVAGATLATLMVLERSAAMLRGLKPLYGLPWTLLLVLPWLIAIGWLSDGAFFAEAVGQDLLGKIATGQESHGAPPGVHALAAFATFWPLSALLPVAIGWAVAHRSDRRIAFLAAWAIPAWIVFEAVATKLPNYVLPLMPAFAVLAALAAAEGALAPTTRWRRICFALLAVIGLALGIGLNAGFVMIEGRASVPGLIGGVLIGAASVAGWRLLAKGWTRSGIAAALLASALAAVTAYGILLPDAGRMWLSDRLAGAVADVRTCPDPLVVSIGYREPSLIFRLGTGTRLADAATGAAAFAGAPCAVAMVERGQSEAFLAAASGAGITLPAPVRRVEARNVNGLKPRTFDLYVRP